MFILTSENGSEGHWVYSLDRKNWGTVMWFGPISGPKGPRLMYTVPCVISKTTWLSTLIVDWWNPISIVTWLSGVFIPVYILPVPFDGKPDPLCGTKATPKPQWRCVILIPLYTDHRSPNVHTVNHESTGLYCDLYVISLVSGFFRWFPSLRSPYFPSHRDGSTQSYEWLPFL